MKKSILSILVVFFFLATFLCLSANSISYVITYEDFLVMWRQAQVNLETNNPGGHSEVFTETEVVPESIQLSYGWIEGVGVWGIEGFNWFGPGVMPVIQIGYYDEDGIYHPTGLHEETPRVKDENYTYYTLIAPPDFANFSPGTNFPSIGFYVPDDNL